MNKKQQVSIAFSVTPKEKQLFVDLLGKVAELVFLREEPTDVGQQKFQGTDVLISWNPQRDLRGTPCPESLKFIQIMSAGFDHLEDFNAPSSKPIILASNAGAFNDSVAEYALMVCLAALRQLPMMQEEMRKEHWRFRKPGRTLFNKKIGIIGFGGIGQRFADLTRVFSPQLHVINRTGKTNLPVESVSTLDRLPEILPKIDILLLSLPLNSQTENLIGQTQLETMKKDVVIINLARAKIINQQALYQHLLTNLDVTAALDVWWQEPQRNHTFSPKFPFHKLPNVIATPHQANMVKDWMEPGIRHASENVLRYLEGNLPQRILDL